MKSKLKVRVRVKEEKASRLKSRKLVLKKNGIKMLSASFYIPKGIEGKPLGEDAHFIRATEETIGVADGVGGWAKHGIDSGEFARALMRNSDEAVLRGGVSLVDPKKVLEEAFLSTDEDIGGSSTACILTHRDGKLFSANVGDSGFVVVRNGKVICRSQPQQRYFNSPFQLGNYRTCELPSDAAESQVAVAAGDVVVLCTDGVLDNMFDSDIEAVVGGERRVATTWPEKMAQRIAEEAHRNSLDEDFESPFMIEAENNGYFYKGGKKDDITVVVGKIVNRYDMHYL